MALHLSTETHLSPTLVCEPKSDATGNGRKEALLSLPCDISRIVSRLHRKTAQPELRGKAGCTSPQGKQCEEGSRRRYSFTSLSGGQWAMTRVSALNHLKSHHDISQSEKYHTRILYVDGQLGICVSCTYMMCTPAKLRHLAPSAVHEGNTTRQTAKALRQ